MNVAFVKLARDVSDDIAEKITKQVHDALGSDTRVVLLGEAVEHIEVRDVPIEKSLPLVPASREQRIDQLQKDLDKLRRDHFAMSSY